MFNKKSCLISVLFFFTLISKQVYAENPDPNSLIKRADEYRQLYKDAVMNVRLTRMVGQKKDGESRLKVALRDDASLIRITSGPDSGQQVLMTAQGLWVKLPRSTRNVRITPLQRLLGDAAVGDIGRMHWYGDYAAQFSTPSEGVVEGKSVWLLELKANSSLATYARITVSLSKEDSHPIAAEFFLKSGKAIKNVVFGPVEVINDRKGIKRMEFFDLIKKDNSTQMLIEQIKPVILEPRWFNLESLGEWE
jgi:hypothetical protein